MKTCGLFYLKFRTVQINDYLYLQNNNIYCIFGNKSDKDTNGGYYYSKKKVNAIEFPRSFEIIDYGHAKDEKNLYTYSAICAGIPAICVCSVSKLPIDFKESKRLSNSVWKDNNNVLKYGMIISGADSASFNIIANSSYSKDKNSVYYSYYKIEGIDVNTFQYLGDDYSKDAENVYRQANVMDKVDVETFQYLGDYYAKDAENVYRQANVMDRVDVETFEVLSRRYSKDKNNVYYNGEYIYYANQKTFEVLGNGRATDGINVFKRGNLED